MNQKSTRRLQLESFEPRRMLYAYSEWVPKIDPAASPAAHAAHFVQYNSRFEASPDKTMESFSNRSAADAKLAELVTTYWDGLLGQPVAQVQAVGRAQAYVSGYSYGNETLLSRFNAKTEDRVESDSLAKTADGYIYLPSDSAITIVNAQDPTNLSSNLITAVSDSSDSILLVDGDRLVRVSKPHSTYPNPLYGVDGLVYRPLTKVEVFDISNRTQPVMTGQLTIEGEHVASDVRNGRLTIVQFSDFNLVLPQPATVTSADGTPAFESTAEYISRNRDANYAAVMPSYQRTSTGQSPVSDEIGDWQDLNVALDTLQHRTSILTIDLAGQPQVIDSELILGLPEPMVYVGAENVYLVNNTGSAAEIYRVSVGSDGSVETQGHARLVGAVVQPRFMNEYQGVLRLLAGPGMRTDAAPMEHSSILLTIGDVQGQWRIQGQAYVAKSLLPVSIHYEGPLATALSGENYFEGGIATNFIATLDLSNPAAPRKLNSFQVPGFSTYLKQIDSNHWIGLRNGGPNARGDVSQDRVVTLYNYSPDTGLSVLDSWTDTSVYFTGRVEDPNVEIEYDAETGLVMIDGGLLRPTAMRTSYSPILLRVQLGTDDPLQPVSLANLPDAANRTFVQQGHLLVVTDGSVVTYDKTDLAGRSDIEFLPGEKVTPDATSQHRLTAGQTTILPVLGGYGSDYYKVVSVELFGFLEASKQSKVTVLDSGMLQVQAASVETSAAEYLTIRVRFFDGQEATLAQSLLITGPKYQAPVEETGVDYVSRTYVETTTPVKTWIRLQNDLGQPVSSLQSGEQAWVILGAEDLSELRLGVYGGYFQVDITSGNAEVIGQPEFLGNFTSDKINVPGEHGFTALGATSTRLSPAGSARSDIVRFKIRANSDAPVNISVIPTLAPDTTGPFRKNILVYMGASEIHSTGNTDVAELSTDPIYSTVTIGNGNVDQDVNGDGSITALDVLQIINYINTNSNNGGESAVGPRSIDDLLAKLDVSNDGSVTALDALLVINTLNVSPRSVANGEGEAFDWSLDQPTRRARR